MNKVEQKEKKDAAKNAKKENAAGKARIKNLEELKSTQMLLPIADIKDGIILTKDGRFVLLMEFAPINFLLRTSNEQDQVADAFGSLLRIIPNKIQIKILSRRANVERHVRQIQSYQKKETNKSVIRMQNDTIEMIRQNARNGITRRFYLSFEYTRPAGLRSPTWEDIRAEMYTTANRISAYLSVPPCENALLSPIGDTDYVIDMLYDCTCRAQSEDTPLDVKCESVIRRFVEKGRAKDGQFIPVTEFLSPGWVDPSHYRYLDIDGKFYAFLYIIGNSYEEKCVSGWLNQYITMGSGIDLDLFISREPKDVIQSSMVYTQRFNKVRMKRADDTNADYDDLEKQVDAGYYLRNGMNAGHEFCYFTVMLTVTADSKIVLDTKVQNVQKDIAASNLKSRVINFSQVAAFESSLPLCKPVPSIIKNGRRNVLSMDLGSAYPFTSFEVNDIGGIMLGLNSDNGSPVFINAFNKALYENANISILGSSGMGKTYLSQCITLRLRQQRVKNIIIAPLKGRADYKRSCDAVDGEFIEISAGSPHTINIMEIRKMDTSLNDVIDGDSAKGSILLEKAQKILTFLTLLLPDITTIEKHEADEAILSTYRKYGITEHNKSLEDPRNPGHYKQMPILGDLHEELKKRRPAARLSAALGRFVTGSAKSFNGQTNVDLKNLTTVFDLSLLSKELLPLGLFICTDYVYDVIRENRTERKAILFDEVWKLIGAGGNSSTAEFVLEIVKTVRAFNAMSIVITQDLSDFFALENGKYGQNILNNTKINFILGIKSKKEADIIARELSLSEVEKNNILNYKRGVALLIANRNHIQINVKASASEDMVITTDPEQLARIYNKYINSQKAGVFS